MLGSGAIANMRGEDGSLFINVAELAKHLGNCAALLRADGAILGDPVQSEMVACTLISLVESLVELENEYVRFDQASTVEEFLKLQQPPEAS